MYHRQRLQSEQAAAPASVGAEGDGPAGGALAAGEFDEEESRASFLAALKVLQTHYTSLLKASHCDPACPPKVLAK